MLPIFKPPVRQVLTQNAASSHQGAIGRTQAIVKQLEEVRKRHLLSILSLPSTKLLERARVILAQIVPRKILQEGLRVRVKTKTLRTNPKGPIRTKMWLPLARGRITRLQPDPSP